MGFLGIATDAGQEIINKAQDTVLKRALLDQSTTDGIQSSQIHEINNILHKNDLLEKEHDLAIKSLESKLNDYKSELDDCKVKLASHDRNLQQLNAPMMSAKQFLHLVLQFSANDEPHRAVAPPGKEVADKLWDVVRKSVVHTDATPTQRTPSANDDPHRGASHVGAPDIHGDTENDTAVRKEVADKLWDVVQKSIVHVDKTDSTHSQC